MYLGIDSSTQSISALVLDAESGEVVFDHSINFGQDLPKYNAPSGFIPGGENGEVHANPLMWVEALDALFQAMQVKGFDFASIKGISGAGQQHGSVYLNANFDNTLAGLSSEKSLVEQLRSCFSRETSPIWMDTSTSQYCDEIANALGGHSRVCSISGSNAIERFTGPQIRKFFKESPEAYNDTKRIHLVSSFIASLLCGKSVSIDYGDGAGMNLLNLEKGQWDSELLEATAAGLQQKLPNVEASDKVGGTIADYFIQKYGFKSGTPVVLFSGDNPSSLVGMGGVKPGTAVISLGTSDTFFASMSKAVTDPNGYGHVFGNPGGGFMSLICFLNGSLARERLKDDLGLAWDDFGKSSLSKVPSGNSGNFMLPFYGQEITPFLKIDEPKRYGDESFLSGENAVSQIRALLEGQFINMKLHSAWISDEPELIRVTGGASQNDGIVQTIADVFSVPVQRMSVSNSSGLGGALRAANTVGGISWDDLEKRCLEKNFLEPVQPDLPVKSTYEDLEKQYAGELAVLLGN